MGTTWMQCICNKYPQSWTSWDPRGTDAWHTGPANDHYQCYQMYIMDIKKIQTFKGITFLPWFCPIPKVQSWDYDTQIADKLLVEIEKPNKGKPRKSSKHLQALEQQSNSSSMQLMQQYDHPYCKNCTNCVTLTNTKRHCENNTSN